MYTFLGFPKVAIDEIKELDAVIFGVPFDDLSTYRKGPKYAPKAIRKASECYDPYVPDLDFDFSNFNIADLGDVKLGSNDPLENLSKIEDFANSICRERVRFAVFGGDHSVTLPIAKALSKNFKKVGLIWIDAHLDFWEEYPEGIKISHATVLKRILETTNISAKNVINLGFRAYGSAPYEKRYAEKYGVKIISTKDLFKKETLRQIDTIVKEISENVEALHVSIDIDVLDPAFAPGVTNPEPGGISTRDLLNILEIIGRYNFSFDVVELAPPYDISEITAHAATVITIQALGLMLSSNLTNKHQNGTLY